MYNIDKHISSDVTILLVLMIYIYICVTIYTYMYICLYMYMHIVAQLESPSRPCRPAVSSRRSELNNPADSHMVQYTMV